MIPAGPSPTSSSSASSDHAPSPLHHGGLSSHRPQLSPKDLNRGQSSTEYFGLPSRRGSSSSSTSTSTSTSSEPAGAGTPGTGSGTPAESSAVAAGHANMYNATATSSPSSNPFHFNLNLSSHSPSSSNDRSSALPASAASSSSASASAFASASASGASGSGAGFKWAASGPGAGAATPWQLSGATTPSINSNSSHGFNFGSSSSSSLPQFRLQRPGGDSIRGPAASMNSTTAGSTTPLAQPPGPSPFFPVASASSTTPIATMPTTSNSSFANNSSTFTFNAPPPLSLRRPPSINSVNSSSASPSSAGMSLALGRSPASNPATSSASASPATVGIAKFASIAPSALIDLLVADASSVLALDMRTHTVFLTAHLRRTVSVCVPSTLLRRPGYGIDRVHDGLPPNDQEAFSNWVNASSVIVFDAESSLCGDASPLASMLNKFAKAGFQGQLGWVKGGWAALKAEVLARGLKNSLLEYGPSEQPTSPSSELDVGSGGSGAESTDRPGSSASGTSTNSTSKKHARPVLQVRDLPIAAFQQSSTSAFVQSGAGGMIGGRPTSESSGSGARSDGQRLGVIKRRKSGYAPYRSKSSEVEGGERIAGDHDAEVRSPGSEGGERRMATNPFFDNIRQNSEALSLSRMLENLTPIEFDAVPAEIRPRIPPFLSALIDLPPFERARVLAYQFYELESAERKRLQGALHWHANVQGKDGDHDQDVTKYEKFGISAGVELGSLNRFKNIFPYEHARVRLQRHAAGVTDYVNASHIQLAGSTRRFIASQGPLPSTYTDFWQTCEQHRVGVVVMLTNLMENGREKCGRYWGPQPSEDWNVETTGGDQIDDSADVGPHEPAREGGFFAPTNSSASIPNTDHASTVRRTILVRRKSAQLADRPARKVRHIHYRAWPDFDIPASPYELVELVHEVERAQEDYKREIGWPEGGNDPPIVVNCAAGCGRTGVFIIISTMLDMLRRERRKQAQARSLSKDRMEIDSPVLSASTSRFVFNARAQQYPTSPASSASATSSLDMLSRQQQHFAPPPATTPSSLIPDTASLSLNSPLLPASLAAPRMTSTSLSSLNSQPSTSSSPSPSFSSTSSPTHSVAPSHPPPPTSGPTLPLTLPDTPTRVEPALKAFDPVFAGVNEMREQRMSMVANYRQFVCVHECVLVGVVKEMQEEAQEEDERRRVTRRA